MMAAMRSARFVFAGNRERLDGGLPNYRRAPVVIDDSISGWPWNSATFSAAERARAANFRLRVERGGRRKRPISAFTPRNGHGRDRLENISSAGVAHWWKPTVVLARARCGGYRVSIPDDAPQRQQRPAR